MVFLNRVKSTRLAGSRHSLISSIRAWENVSFFFFFVSWVDIDELRGLVGVSVVEFFVVRLELVAGTTRYGVVAQETG